MKSKISYRSVLAIGACILMSFSVVGCVFRDDAKLPSLPKNWKPDGAPLAFKMSEASLRNVLAKQLPPRTFSGEQCLLQLGMPTESTVSIWYADNSLNAKGNSVKSVQIKKMSDPESFWINRSEAIKWSFSQKNRCGIITLSELDPNERYSVRIVFADGGNEELEAWTKPRYGKEKNIDLVFSAGSCFAPFQSDPTQSGSPSVTISRRNAAMMATLSAVSESSPPKFYLGIGDQVYVDLSASEKVRLNKYLGLNEYRYLPMSDREQVRKEMGRRSLAVAPEGPFTVNALYGIRSQFFTCPSQSMSEVLRGIYHAHFSIRHMHTWLKNVPSSLMWDDHEIRDGWGLHGDEASFPQWAKYYSQVRDVFVAYQSVRNSGHVESSKDADWLDLNSGLAIPSGGDPGSLSHKFNFGQACVFSPDGKSPGTDLRKEITSFIEETGNLPGDRFLVVCWQVPLFFSESTLSKIFFPVGSYFSSTLYELKDDRKSESYSDKPLRDFILSSLFNHVRSRSDRKLILIGGDVHFSGVQTLRYGDEKGPVLGYQIISSGICQTSFNSDPSLTGTFNPIELPDGNGNRYKVHAVSSGPLQSPSIAEMRISQAREKNGGLDLQVRFITCEFGGKAYVYPKSKFAQCPWFTPETLSSKTELSKYLFDEYSKSGVITAIPGPGDGAIKSWDEVDSIASGD